MGNVLRAGELTYHCTLPLPVHSRSSEICTFRLAALGQEVWRLTSDLRCINSSRQLMESVCTKHMYIYIFSSITNLFC